MADGRSTAGQESFDRPQGALPQDDGSVFWCVWAPFSTSVSLVLLPAESAKSKIEERQVIAMEAEEFGYFSHRAADVADGLRYCYRLDDGRDYPDPASRWQPQGVHQASAVFRAADYQWHDSAWRGVAREDLAFYELHVGTFTPEGTFAAIVPRLAQLAELGVTALELMPVAQFPGTRGWGYDGAYPYAAQNSYGGPRALQRLVDAAHCAGLATILDVVYNHFGPEGSYIGKFGHYFSDRYHTPWGNAINYDGPDSEPVRRFVLDNARMWVRDFRFDGLRLDAIQTIYDRGAKSIVGEIRAAAQAEAERQNRTVHIIAETNENDVRQVRPADRGGWGLSGVWSDDFHHSVHSLLTGERDGYYSDFGQPAHLAKALNDVFVYDGCYSRFHRRRRGTCAAGVERTRFVQSIQNHDQVGNRALGDRFGTLLPPPAQRLACALLLFSPCIPLLFMGEEYGEVRPFPFFCSFSEPELIEAVRKGRRREFAELEFKWKPEVPDPQDAATFESAKLTWSWAEGTRQAQVRQLYRDLLAARRRWPALQDRGHCRARLGDGPAAVLILERGTYEASLTAVANLTARELIFPDVPRSRQPFEMSTEDSRYGGLRTADWDLDRLFPYELVVF